MNIKRAPRFDTHREELGTENLQHLCVNWSQALGSKFVLGEQTPIRGTINILVTHLSRFGTLRHSVALARCVFRALP